MTMNLVPLPLWISERDVAERWGVSIFTVQRERKRGKLKAKRIGGRWKYRDDSLREYEDKDTPCQSNSKSEVLPRQTPKQPKMVRLLVRSRGSTN